VEKEAAVALDGEDEEEMKEDEQEQKREKLTLS
jgi:hypothetical protein